MPLFARTYRDPRPKRLEPDREPAGPGAGDAGPALAQPAAQQSGPVRPPVAAAAAAQERPGPAGRAHLLPPDDRQHAYGEGTLRHVQKLTQ